MVLLLSIRRSRISPELTDLSCGEMMSELRVHGWRRRWIGMAFSRLAGWSRSPAALPFIARLFFFVAASARVSLVLSCRAEITDSPAGCCGNRSGAERGAGPGRGAFTGEA